MRTGCLAYGAWLLGRFKLRVRCTTPVLESFPLQPMTQPRPLPTVAYPPTFYPGVKQVEQAQVIEVSPGIEKTGVDFQMGRLAFLP